MKKYLTILLFFCISHTYGQSFFYVSPTGNDVTGNGSIGNPYKTIFKATSIITTANSIINVEAGTYNEVNQSILAPGVSLVGVDTNSTHVNYFFYNPNAVSGAIQLTSTTENTNGNQTIQNIDFNVIANDSVSTFICVIRRGSVTVTNCRFNKALNGAVYLFGETTADTPPTTYSQNNTVYNCSFYDCHDRNSSNGRSAGGSIGMNGQQTLSIHNNIFNNTGKPQGHNGDCIGGIHGYNRNVQIYANQFFKPLNEGNVNNFAIEEWFDNGYWQIYGNTFNGGGNSLDVGIGGCNKGIYDTAFSIHDNIFQASANPPFVGTPQWIGSWAVQVEPQSNPTAGNLWMWNNTCTNIGSVIHLTVTHGNAPLEGLRRVWVHNNLGANLGYTSGAFGAFMVFIEMSAGTGMDSIMIDNNTLVSKTTSPQSQAGVYVNNTSTGVIKHIYIRNNIIENVNPYGYVTWDGTTTIDSCFVQSNIAFGNSFTNNIFTHGTPTVTHLTTTPAVIKSNPLLLANYHLSAGSPAIGTANPVIYQVDIGAFPFSGKINPTITWSNQTMTYGTSILATQNASTGIPGSYVYNINGTPNAGVYNNYTVTFTPTDTVTYNSATKTVTLTVNPASSTIIASNTTVPYNGLQQTPTITTNPAGLSTATLYNGISTAPINAGSYSCTTSNTDPNHTATPINYTFTITPKAGTFTVSNTSYTYDSLLHTVSVATSDPAITYTITGAPQRYSGLYTVIVHNTNSNFNVPDAVVTMTIAKAQAPAVIWNPANITYNAALGAPQLNAGDVKGASYAYNPAAGFIPIPPSQVLSVTATFNDTNLLPQTVQRTITVSKGSATINIVGSSLTQPFDGTPKFISYTTTPAGIDTVTVFYDDSHTSVGSHTGHVHLSSPLYTASDVPFTLTITAVSGNISLSNYTGLVYNGAQQQPTVTTTPNGAPYTLTFNGSSTAPIHPGTYTVIGTLQSPYVGADTVTMVIIKANQTGASWPQIPNQTYLYTVQSGILNASSPIAGTGVYNVNLGDTLHAGIHTLQWVNTPTDATDYNVLVLTNTFSVSQGVAVLSASNLLQTYDSSAKFIIITTTPFGLSGVTVTYSGGGSAINAGSYTANISLTNSDWTATPITATLVIQKANAILSYPAQSPIVFQTPLSTLNFNATSNKSGVFTYNYPVGKILNPGSWQLIGTFHPTNTNYNSNSVSTIIIVYGSTFIKYYYFNGKVVYLNYPY